MKMPFEWVVGDSSKGLHGDRAHVYDETGHRELHHVKGHYLKSPDQEIFFFASATKSAISATFSMWLALSNLAVLWDSAERSAHCELLGAWLRLLKGETERANPSVSSPTRRARSGACFRSLCSRRRPLSSRCPHRHVVSSDRVEVVDRELEREE